MFGVELVTMVLLVWGRLRGWGEEGLMGSKAPNHVPLLVPAVLFLSVF